MTFAQPRRWFRFSLRTLFVLVTVGCVWLGWQVNWINARRSKTEVLQARGINVSAKISAGAFTRYQTIPLWRKWLGDLPVGAIYCLNGTLLADEKAHLLTPAQPMRLVRVGV